MVKRANCSRLGCNRLVHASGLCQKHYDQRRRSGGKGAPSPADKVCSVPGCTRPYHARGYCQKHYDLQRKRSWTPPAGKARGAEATPRAARAAQGQAQQPPRHGATCCIPGCGRPHHAKGYCKSHYSQLRRRGGFPAAGKPPGVCEVEGCNRPAIADGRCARHMGHPTTVSRKRLSKAERLKLIKQRHAIMKREIAMINRALEDED